MALTLIKEGVSTTHLQLLSFHHSLRKCNSCAGWLLKYGARLKGDSIF